MVMMQHVMEVVVMKEVMVMEVVVVMEVMEVMGSHIANKYGS